MNKFTQEQFHEKLLEVLGGFIIVPVMDQTRRGMLMGRRELSRQLYNFIDAELRKQEQNNVNKEINNEQKSNN